MKSSFYSSDLAHIHDAGFGRYARVMTPEIVRVLARLKRRRAEARTQRPLVVEIGCGAGTTARALLDTGFDVVGIDRSPAMLRLARRRAPGATFRLASWATARMPACAAIVGIGEIVSYMTVGGPPKTSLATRQHGAQLQQFFINSFEALRPGGMLLFDFMASARGRTYKRFVRVENDWSLEMQATANKSQTIVTRRLSMTRRVHGRLRKSQETHRVRIYTHKEMGRMLRDAGFKVSITGSIGRRPVFRSNAAALCVK